MKNQPNVNLRATSFAALALAFASVGDAFLYAFLPLNFNGIGISVVWVGLLLSVNRFIRIISNSLMVHAFAKYGLRLIMIIAAGLAVMSTFGYAIAAGIMSWLLFRIMWGLAFSAMRIGTLGYALQHRRQGFALGISRSLQDLGPMIALFLTPVFLGSFDSRSVFYGLALLSIPAVYFAWSLPVGDDKTPAVEGTKLLKWPSTLNSMTLISAIVIDGIVVVVLGVLFVQYRDEISVVTATALAGLYLGYRRICLVALSPAGGWIADKIGFDRIFSISMSMIVIGLIFIVSGWVATGAVVVFTFYSVNSAIAPGSASKNKPHSLAAVAENATWRDVGAAIGTLLGGLMISSQDLTNVLVVAIFVMITVLLVHVGIARRPTKLFSYGGNNNL